MFAKLLTAFAIGTACAHALSAEEEATGSVGKKADHQIVVPMAVDVDGAPTAYGPDNRKALDYELNAHVNAKKSGAIVGYRTDQHHKPIVQTSTDPAPGFYISETAYTDINNANKNDPRRYVNAAEINYTVLAKAAASKGVRTGDICVVHAIKKNKTVFAIVGDTGHANGAEGSLALLQRLGFNVKNGKSVPAPITDIVVRYFAGSNPSRQFFFTQADLDAFADALHLDADFSSFHQ